MIHLVRMPILKKFMKTKSSWPLIIFFLLISLTLGACAYGSVKVKNIPPNPLAYDQFPQKPTWVFEAQEEVKNTPLVKGDRVFIRTERAVYALNAHDGKLLWKTDYPVEPDWGFPQMAISDILLVPGGRSSVVSYSPEDGRVLWADHWLHSIGQSTVISIAFLDNLTYVGRSGSTLTAYEQKYGNIQWQGSVLARAYFYLYTYENSVFIADKHTLKAYDGVSGKLLLQKDFEEYIGPILIDNGILYVETGIDQVNLIAIDLATFTKIWERALPDYSNFKTNTITSYSNSLLVSGDAFFAIDNNSGDLLWEKNNGEIGDAGRPVVLGSRVYVRNSSGSLWSLDLETGKYLGKVKLQGNGGIDCLCEDGPAIYKDLLIIPYGDNRVFAYRP